MEKDHTHFCANPYERIIRLFRTLEIPMPHIYTTSDRILVMFAALKFSRQALSSCHKKLCRVLLR